VASLLAFVEDGTINGKIAKKVFSAMVETGKSPETIIDEQGLAQVTDTAAIEAEVRQVIESNPGQVEQYKAGKQSLIGYFVGQVMKATKGAANPKVVNEILRRLLDEA
jgi:aspartyl-tRNA(Asn)/glutamyl-tRNA(Gln) amidotransferase subunit B